MITNTEVSNVYFIVLLVISIVQLCQHQTAMLSG